MNNISINYEKCIGCMRCVGDCTNQYIVKDTKGDAIRPSVKERGYCIKCGHCKAICPVDAIEMLGYDDYEASDSLLDIMVNKRTVRHYKKEMHISDDIIEKLILAAQSAPTDRNRRSARIIFIKDLLPKVYNLAVDYLTDEVSKDGNINPLYQSTMRMNDNRAEILWNAEYLVIYVGAQRSIVDAAISAERMQLMAERLFISTGYRGDMTRAINNSSELRDLLGVKTNEEVLISFAMGISDVKYNRPVVKKNRKVELL